MDEFEAERLAGPAPALGREPMAAALKLQSHLVLGGVELDVNDVFDRVPVDGQQRVAGLEAKCVRE
jgi:hypothetical protein